MIRQKLSGEQRKKFTSLEPPKLTNWLLWYKSFKKLKINSELNKYGESSSGGSLGRGLSDHRQAAINKVDEIINYLRTNQGNIDGDRLINLVKELLNCV